MDDLPGLPIRRMGRPVRSVAMPTDQTPVTRLMVIRHGQSEWNAAGRWQGRADPPLTTEGRRQAAAAARVLGSFDAIVSSPLQRAAETAAIIVEHLGIGPVLTEPDLMERDAGEWQGLTRAEIETDWPGFLEHGERPPAYEPDDVMLDRVLGALGRVTDRAKETGGEILVVAHGGVVYTLEEACGEPWRRIPNLGGRWFEMTDGHLTAGPRVNLVSGGTLPDVL